MSHRGDAEGTPRERLVDTLHRVGQAITSQLQLDEIVQLVTDEATELTPAAFGAFFYNHVDASGESFLLYTISGVDRSRFERFPNPRATAIFAPTFNGEGTVLLDDVTADPRFGKNPPYNGHPPGHLPVRSYLAVPVILASGDVAGGLFFGHPEPGRFSEDHAWLVEGIASYAAIAIDNARLYERSRHIASVLQESLLPPSLPAISGVDVAARYDAGSTNVGGDFYDIFPLPAGRWGFVIGDMCGQGPEAASRTALARHTVRTAAVLEPDDTAVMTVLNDALLARDEPDRFCTAVYGTLTGRPGAKRVRLANAGHPAPLVRRSDGTVEDVGAPGTLLGVVDEAAFGESEVVLAQGDALVLFTDGVIEARDGDGEEFGLARLRHVVSAETDAGSIAAAVERAVLEHRAGAKADDLAVLVLQATAVELTPSSTAIIPSPEAAVHDLLAPAASDTGTHLATSARREAARIASATGHDALVLDVELVVAELVSNAILHGGGCTAARVLVGERGLRVEVEDRSPVPPVLGHATEASLTGRGMRLISQLSSRVGAEPTASGKVIWAEITDGEPHSDRDAADLLDAWAEDWPEQQLPEAHVRVELGEVPTRLLLAAKGHVDNLVREFALFSDAESARTGASRLHDLLRVVDEFRDVRLAIKRQALAAHERGHATTHLVLELPVDASGAAEAYLAALDELDAYCRAGRLLTLETPPQHRLFRRWYIGELIAQLRAREDDAGVRTAPMSFHDCLLAEVDRMDAAQRAAQRTSRLYALASALATAASPEAVAEAVLVEGVAALGATAGGVLLASDEDRLWLPGALGYDDDVIERLRNEPLDAALPAAHAFRTGEPVWVESRAERDQRFPELAGLERDTSSMCAVPLQVGGRRLGAVRFSFEAEHLFDDPEREFVLTLASLAAQALDRAELQRIQFDQKG